MRLELLIFEHQGILRLTREAELAIVPSDLFVSANETLQRGERKLANPYTHENGKSVLLGDGDSVVESSTCGRTRLSELWRKTTYRCSRFRIS